VKLLYLFPEEFTGRFAREYHVYRLAESMAAAGADVVLAAAPSSRLFTAEQLHDFFGGTASARLQVIWLKREVSIGPWKIRSGARFYRQVDRLLATLQPDAVFTMHVKAADWVTQEHPTLPLIFEAHEIFADNYSENSERHRRLLETERRIYRRVRGVTAISGYLAECLQSRFDLHVPVQSQHDGIDEAMLLGETSPPDPHELIYTGSLQAWKGVPVAVEAMRLLPEFHLTVIGGEGESLENLRRNAPANVTFLGRLPRAELLPHLQKASLGLMPNLLEPRGALYTFPLKLLEYSAAGRGIVASKIPIFDRLDLGRWTTLFPSGSVEGLAGAVRERLAAGIDVGAARAWAAQFLWPRQGERMKQFIASALKLPSS
jgi:glycosyltransferase involved in cell wall biosynthesis